MVLSPFTVGTTLGRGWMGRHRPIVKTYKKSTEKVRKAPATTTTSKNQCRRPYLTCGRRRHPIPVGHLWASVSLSTWWLSSPSAASACAAVKIIVTASRASCTRTAASSPAIVSTFCLGFHVRHIIAAGHKIELVRQIETAAMKPTVRATRGAPFTPQSRSPHASWRVVVQPRPRRGSNYHICVMDKGGGGIGEGGAPSEGWEISGRKKSVPYVLGKTGERGKGTVLKDDERRHFSEVQVVPGGGHRVGVSHAGEPSETSFAHRPAPK
uniref:Uncharacterized protein n=1 Tax=Zea mays TaxID=4577 RepID=A0A804PXZ1_MAIZE